MAKYINQFAGQLLQAIGVSVDPDSLAVSILGHVIAAMIHVFLLLNLVAVGALVFIWLERKISGRIQDRLGPTRVGGKFGWLQTLADGLKLITKEDLMPEGADPLLFRLAPYVSFCASLAAFIALPFAGQDMPFVAQHLNVGVFFILAVLGLEVFGVILAGYSSASKWALFGAMREAAQVISYEVPLGLCAVVPVLLAGSMDLIFIGDCQTGWFTNWYVFHDPFTFVVFWIYFTCATASVNRAPFDLAEAESELVAGFHTEYSGLRWSFFFMAEYGSMLLVALLASILFLGGWNGPIPVAQLIGLQEGGWLYANLWPGWGTYLACLLGAVNVIAKGCLGITVMIWIRWTLPRLRIDQVMTTCLKYCVPIAAVMFLGTTTWQFVMPGRTFFGFLPAPQNAFEVKENWSNLLAMPRPVTPAPKDAPANDSTPKPQPPPADETQPKQTHRPSKPPQPLARK